MAPGSGIYHNTSYEIWHDEILWHFNEAVGFLAESDVTQRPSDLATNKLVVMCDSDWSKYVDPIWTAGSGPDSDFYRDFLIEDGVDPDEAAKVARGQLLRARMKGLPLADDPLKYVVLVRENEQGFVDLTDAVARAQAAKNEPRSRAEREALYEQMVRQRNLRRHAERLKGILVVVTGNPSLNKAVEDHADSAWLDKELAEYEKTFDLEF